MALIHVKKLCDHISLDSRMVIITMQAHPFLWTLKIQK
ncbi:hypothetical protein J540_3412 [Acinetobacter baumannii 1440422]|nr:hypothetical protein J540_3412 [Acinetobacter baumannii 1440422]